MENYLKGSTLGVGTYGTVNMVECRKTGQVFALKYHKELDDVTVRELSCLAALRGHPHVIYMHDCFIADGKIAMLMSYVPYTLSEAIHNGYGWKLYLLHAPEAYQLIPLSFMAHFSVQVADALAYMHRLNMIHRDLTPFNVLLTEDLTVKVADMGLSRLSCKLMTPEVVTQPYRAPELFVENKQYTATGYTCAIDMWSLGVLIVDAMEGKAVFSAVNEGEQVSTYQIILRTLCPEDHPCAPTTRRDPAAIMPQTMECDLVKRIVFRLLAFCENERLLAHELLQDKEWLQVAHMTEEDKNLVRERIQQHKKKAQKRL
ncbi:uncharacterized protein LOC128355446 [Scomber japonicus]|uniref:uncharacterized protein LOC128355446 n=1 Tax=Scomber japonicus TaxID=13676 RepID=UPI002305C5F9|nr:uncharacterized protein LOC128355446 [Scomber japonicus]